jgi:glycosyltransferase involved in cell wall biosynthesis
MKVAYDFNIPINCGISTYNNELLDSLNTCQNKYVPYLIEDSIDSHWPFLYTIENYFYYSYELTNYLNNIGASIFHCTRNFPVPKNASCKIVTTIHDIIPLVLKNDYSKRMSEKIWYKINYNNSISKSDKIITISKFSRDEIIKFYPHCKNKIRVIYQGCSQDFGKNISGEVQKKVVNEYNLTKPYILTIGGAEPRKNVQSLIDAFNQSKIQSHDLVVIGNQWRDKILISRDKNVKIITNVTRMELISIYRSSSVFVFPSIYEGFGLPVLEAMSCGVPVIAHNGSSIVEIAGKSALLIDMNNINTCIIAIKKIISDRIFANELIESGLELVKEFQWSKTAKETVEIYDEVMSRM